MSAHGTDETPCPVCGRAHVEAQESCQVRLASEPDRTRLDTGPFGRSSRSDRSWSDPGSREISGNDAPDETFARRPEEIAAAPGDHTSPVAIDLASDGRLAPGAQIGEFVVEGKIGEGGMGVVYRATHPLIGKKAVIKVIRESLGGEAELVQRFIREARAVNQIGHPNIVDVFSFGTLPDRRPYFVMEWLQGESLATRLERGRLPVHEALEILIQVVSALDAAHTSGVIHRDLKPDNVYLVALPNDDRPLVKLLDFGLAKITEARNDLFLGDSEAGVILGTPSYLSPEVARGNEVDHRSDIYTLGVLAFEMLTGQRPFVGDDPRKTIIMHMTKPPPSARGLQLEVPPAIDTLLLEMMAKEPGARPPLVRVRAVISDLLGIKSAAFKVESPEEDTTGARTSDFRRLDIRDLIPQAQPDWSAGVADSSGSVSIGELDRVPEPPREDATRIDGELDSTIQRQAQDSGVSEEADDDADPTRLQPSRNTAPPQPVQRRLGSLPSITNDLLPNPMPPPPRAESRPVLEDAPRGDAQARLDAPAGRGSLPSLPRLPLRERAGERVGRALRRLGERVLADDGRRTQRLVVIMLVLLLPIVAYLIPRVRSGDTNTPTTALQGEVKLSVRGLPLEAMLIWGKRPLAGNPTVVPRGDEPVTLTIASPGYETVKIDLTPNDDLEFSVALVPLRR